MTRFHCFHDHRAFREGNILKRILYIMIWVAIGIFVASFFAALFALVVQLIWNAVIPKIFGLPAITFWQAFGITVLAKLLFGGVESRFRGMPAHSRRKCSMNPETPYSTEHRDDYEHYWSEEGKAAFEAYLMKQKYPGKNEIL